MQNFEEFFLIFQKNIQRSQTQYVGQDQYFLIVKYNTPIKGLHYTVGGFSLSCGICFYFQ